MNHENLALMKTETKLFIAMRFDTADNKLRSMLSLALEKECKQNFGQNSGE